MAERSTAHSADGTTQRDDDPGDIDSWVSQLSQARADESDGSEWPEAASPQWCDDGSDPYGESGQPEDTNQEHEPRHARHQRYGDEYEQYDGADDRHEDAYRQPDPVTPPASYGGTGAGPVHEDGYAAVQETYVLPGTGYAHEGHHPYDDYAGPSGYRHEEPEVRDPEAVVDGRLRSTHSRELGARPRPAGRRRWLIAVAGHPTSRGAETQLLPRPVCRSGLLAVFLSATARLGRLGGRPTPHALRARPRVRVVRPVRLRSRRWSSLGGPLRGAGDGGCDAARRGVHQVRQLAPGHHGQLSRG